MTSWAAEGDIAPIRVAWAAEAGKPVGRSPARLRMLFAVSTGTRLNPTIRRRYLADQPDRSCGARAAAASRSPGTT
jgi:hypothetical protein